MESRSGGTTLQVTEILVAKQVLIAVCEETPSTSGLVGLLGDAFYNLADASTSLVVFLVSVSASATRRQPTPTVTSGSTTLVVTRLWGL